MNEELKKQLLADYPTWEAFVKAQDPRQLIVNYDQVQRLSDVFRATPVTLLLLSETYSLKNNLAGLDYLSRWITFLNDFLNINKGIPQQYVSPLAYILYAEYDYFYLADLKLLINFILESRYGPFYGSIDTQRIVSSFFYYNRERNEVFGRVVERLKKQENDNSSQITDEEHEKRAEIANFYINKINQTCLEISQKGK